MFDWDLMKIGNCSMKKTLLATTVLGSLFTTSGHGIEAPDVKFSGTSSLNYTVFNNSNKDDDGGKGQGHRLGVESSKFYVDAEGKAEQFDYSLRLAFTGEANEKFGLKENRLKLSSHFGTFVGGNTRGVVDRMPTGGFRVMGATGGMTGRLTNSIAVASGAVIDSDFVGNTTTKTKLIYYTPRWNGLMLGLDFTPDGKHKGDADLKTNHQPNSGDPYGRNVIGLGVNYQKELENDLKIELSSTIVTGKAMPGTKAALPGKAEDIFTWGVGAKIDYKGFEIGAEYSDLGKSGVNKTDINNGKAGKFFDVAVGYSFGKNKFAVGYYQFTRKLGTIGSSRITGLNSGDSLGSAKAKVFSVTYDRKIVPGLKTYAEVNLFNTRSTTNAGTYFGAVGGKNIKNNRGHVALVGTKLSF